MAVCYRKPRREESRMDRSKLSRFVSSPVAELPPGEVLTVSSTDTARDTVARMSSSGASCAVVVAGGKIHGIFTERDVLTRCMDDGFDWDTTLENGLLTPNPRTITPETTVVDAIAIMQKHGYRTLPVARGPEPAGLIRLSDVLTHLAEAYPEEILNLPPRPDQVAEKREGG